MIPIPKKGTDIKVHHLDTGLLILISSSIAKDTAKKTLQTVSRNNL